MELSTLTLLFIILKLTDMIDWSWWWVFSPSILSFFLFFGLILLYPIAKGNS